MQRPRAVSWRSLPPLVAGLLLLAVGWWLDPPVEPPSVPSQVALSPHPLKTTLLRGSWLPSDGPRFSLETPASVELARPQWPSKAVRLEPVSGVTAVRLPSPRATVSVSVAGDSAAEVEFVRLPDRSKVASSQGQARLEPGAHELLVSAPGYLPQRLSVELEPAQFKTVEVALQALPSYLPTDLSGMPAVAPPARSALPPPVWQPAPPQARSVAPPAWSPPPIAPAPRFTPVAPIPGTGTANPQPRFTPVGN